MTNFGFGTLAGGAMKITPAGARRTLAGLLLLGLGGCASLAGGTLETEQVTIGRAVGLLPRGVTVPVVVVDPQLAPDPVAVGRVDAFTVREPDGTMRRAIYVNGRSQIFTEARRGSTLHIAILAAVIHHEAVHLSGAGEPAARRSEREFFRRLVLGGAVKKGQGRTYLSELERAYGALDDRETR